MKLNSLWLAVLLSSPVLANAMAVTVTPMLGYQYLDAEPDQQRDVFRTGMVTNSVTNKPNGGVALDSDISAGVSIGIQVLPKIDVELEYIQTQTESAANEKTKIRFDSRVQNYNANMIISAYDKYDKMTHSFNPYLLLGVGRSVIENKKIGGNRQVVGESTDTIGNAGIGALYHLNEWLAVRGEARAIHNFDENLWQGLALVGLQLNWHTQSVSAPIPMKEVVFVPPVPAKTPVEIAVLPVIDRDIDKDGVLNEADQCPMSPFNSSVDPKTGCPPIVREKMKVELNIHFDTNKAVIKPAFMGQVANVAGKMRDYSDVNTTIEGHTDNTGSKAINNPLSKARANAVKTALVKQYGIDPARITTEGFADTRPVASNATAKGRAENRRVYAVIEGERIVKP